MDERAGNMIRSIAVLALVVAAPAAAQAGILTYQYEVSIDSTSFSTGPFAGATGMMTVEIDVETSTPLTFGTAFTSIYQSSVVQVRATTSLGTETIDPAGPGNSSAQLTSDLFISTGHEDSLNLSIATAATNPTGITSVSALLISPQTSTPSATFMDSLSLAQPLGPVDLSAFTGTRQIVIGGSGGPFTSFSISGTIQSLTIVPAPGVGVISVAGMLMLGTRRRRI